MRLFRIPSALSLFLTYAVFVFLCSSFHLRFPFFFFVFLFTHSAYIPCSPFRSLQCITSFVSVTQIPAVLASKEGQSDLSPFTLLHFRSNSTNKFFLESRDNLCVLNFLTLQVALDYSSSYTFPQLPNKLSRIAITPNQPLQELLISQTPRTFRTSLDSDPSEPFQQVYDSYRFFLVQSSGDVEFLEGGDEGCVSRVRRYSRSIVR